MGTSSLTYIYNTEGRIILIMYRQYDGYPSGHGNDLAIFLESYVSEKNMNKLADDLFSYFKKSEPTQIEMVHPYDIWCHDFQYHIYSDKVKIVGLDEDKEMNWKTNEFKKLCNEDNEDEEKNEDEYNEYKEYKEYKEIEVIPADNNSLGFKLKFSSESISIHNMSWPMEELDDCYFHHCLHQMGCSPKQIAVIIRLIKNPSVEVCLVNNKGMVDLYPHEDEDFGDYEFLEETDNFFHEPVIREGVCAGITVGMESLNLE